MNGKYLFITLCSTLGYTLVNILRKTKRPLYSIFIYFIIFYTIFFVLDKSFALIDDDAKLPMNLKEYIYLMKSSKKPLTECQKDTFLRCSTHCAMEGFNHLNNAKNMSMFIPDDNLKSTCNGAISAAISSIASGGNRTVVIPALLTVLSSYLYEVYENWKKIEIELIKAEICFDMREFYLSILYFDEHGFY